MFCSQCGQPIKDTYKFCGQCGTKVGMTYLGKRQEQEAGGKEEVLHEIASALSLKLQLAVVHGQKSDLEISSVLTDGNWKVGKKKVEYSACLLADSGSRTIIFWERINEISNGLGVLFSFKAETYKSDGKTISGNVKETGCGFGDKVIDYEWDYSQVRHMVEGVAKTKGWEFKTVLLKGKAMY